MKVRVTILSKNKKKSLLINYFNINRNLIRNDVSMLYTNTYEEYDDLLSKNIEILQNGI